MTSNAESQEFAADVVRRDGTEAAMWDGGRLGRSQHELLSDTVHRRVCLHFTLSAWSHRADVCTAARDLSFQSAE